MTFPVKSKLDHKFQKHLLFPQAVREYVLRPHNHIFDCEQNERVILEFSSKPDAKKTF